MGTCFLIWSILGLAATDEQLIPVVAPAAAEVRTAAPTPPSPSTQPAADQPGEPQPFSLLTTPRLTGDWFGARTALEDAGISFQTTLTVNYQQVLKGGVNTHNACRVPGTHDIELTLDFGKMKLIPGGKLYTLATQSWSDSPSGRGWVGGLSDVNGYALGERPIVVSELWYEQSFLDDRIRFRFGKLNLTVDFDTNAFANDATAQFAHSRLANTANIPFGDTSLGALGAQVVVKPTGWLYFGAGAADAEAVFTETGLRTGLHGDARYFGICEMGVTPVIPTPIGELPGSYRVGLWYDPREKAKFFDDLDGRRRTVPTKNNDRGFYASVDQLLIKEHPADKSDTQGLGVFVRYGYAPRDVNEIEHNWAVGGQYQGLIPTRDADVLGIGASQVILSDKIKLQDEKPDRETALEVYYRIQVTPWLRVSPDFQWIFGPGGRAETRDAFVAGIRLQAIF